jgi:hypothetical protein
MANFAPVVQRRCPLGVKSAALTPKSCYTRTIWSSRRKPWKKIPTLIIQVDCARRLTSIGTMALEAIARTTVPVVVSPGELSARVDGPRHVSLGQGLSQTVCITAVFHAYRKKPMKWLTKSGSFAMIGITKSRRLSRRRALRFLGLTVAFGVATSVGVMTSTSTAGPTEAGGLVPRASCTLIRSYVATYSAPVAEAWARSKGATDAAIRSARRCITPQQTAQVG